MKRYLLAACLLTFSFSALAKPGNTYKISPELIQATQSGISKSASAHTNAFNTDKNIIKNSDGEILAYIQLNNTSEATLNQIKATGVHIDKQIGNTLKVWVTSKTLSALEVIDGIQKVRAPVLPITRQQGEEDTEGNAIMQADDVRSGLSITGDGIKVGVISDGIDGLADSVESGDLPGSNTTCRRGGSGVHCGNNDYADDVAGASEGTGMLEIIYDMAPNAELYFATGFPDTIDMIDALDYLTNTAVVDIIVDDLGFGSEPFFEDGPLAQAVQDSIDAGVIYVTAAGNDARRHIQETFHDTDADNIHNFDDTGKNYIIADGGSQAILQWNDDFNEPTNDLDLIIDAYTNADNDCFDNDAEFNGGTYIGTSTTGEDSNTAAGGQALEIVNLGNSSYCYLMHVERTVSDSSSLTFELVVYGLNGENDLEYTETEDSIYGHPALDEVISVGAISSDDLLHDEKAYYSSEGPVTINGETARDKPDLMGIDYVQVTGNGGGLQVPFGGTSAAAPHVAACAALMLEANSQLSHTQVKTILQDTTFSDLGDPDYDNVYGYGLADCLDATTTAQATVGEGRVREAVDSGSSGASCSLEVKNSYKTNWASLLLGLTFLLLVGKKRYQKG
ncbi:S8 family serine peptidase [bacterium]|nr:S8 family serine peptidase [bacterium]